MSTGNFCKKVYHMTIFLFLIKDVTSKNTALNFDNESLSSSEICVTLIKLKQFMIRKEDFFS